MPKIDESEKKVHRITDPAPTSRNTIETQKEKWFPRVCSYLLFIFLSISLFFAIGNLCIALNENKTYGIGPESKLSQTQDESTKNIPSIDELPSQKPKEDLETLSQTLDTKAKEKEGASKLQKVVGKEAESFPPKHENVGDKEPSLPSGDKKKDEKILQKASDQETPKGTGTPQKQKETSSNMNKYDTKEGNMEKNPSKQQSKSDGKSKPPKESPSKMNLKDSKIPSDEGQVELNANPQKKDPKQKEAGEQQKKEAVSNKETDNHKKNLDKVPPTKKEDSKSMKKEEAATPKVGEKKEPKSNEMPKSESPQPSKADPQKRKKRNSSATKEEKEELMQMYTIVEALADEILQQDPKNDVIMQLMPHFESTLKDIEEGKIAGIKEGLLHIQKLLVDLKERLKEVEEAKKQSSSAETDKAKPENIDGKKPVDEVIPDPMYIAPREAAPSLKEETPSSEPIIQKEALKKPDPGILELANSKIEKEPKEAMSMFLKYLEQNPETPDAMLGYAKSLDKLAEIEKSNAVLEQAIYAYRAIVELASRSKGKVPDEILRAAGITCAERMGFRGFQSKSVRVLQQLIDFFPNDIELQNKLGVQLLMMNQPKAAQEVFRKVLSVDPNDGFAQAHYGFALKTEDQNYKEAIKYLKLGIESGAQGTKDGRFYFQLGDSYLRLGEKEKAYEVFEKGANEGLFLNKYQRSLYNIDRLKSQPVWTLEETTYQVFFKNLENNWQKIRDEGLKVLAMDGPNGFLKEKENLSDTGDWKQFELYARGKKITKNCEKAPFTCNLIDKFTAASGCKRGQVKFSVMEPGTHVWPHTGPTNCRLRAHLGLITPKGPSLRIGDVNLNWTEGKVIVFDDSYEHEVWHRGTSPRLILIVDVWHPEITAQERKTLTPL